MISEPYNVQHRIHIEVDPNEPLGLKGLPPEWIEKLGKAGLAREDIATDPSAMIQIISQYEDGAYQFRRASLPTNDEFIRYVQEVTFIESDPSQKYKFTELLGKGAVCKVYKAFNRETKDEVAVRVMKLGNDLQRLKVEIALMTMCANPNVVKYAFASPKIPRVIHVLAVPVHGD